MADADRVITLQVPITFKVPNLPNFLITKDGDVIVDIGVLDNESLKRLAVEFGNELIAHAKRRREERLK